MRGSFKSTPTWRLLHLRWLLVRAGAPDRGRHKVPTTRKGLRLLYRVWAIASADTHRGLAAAIRLAGEHGPLAAKLGREARKGPDEKRRPDDEDYRRAA